MTTREVSSGVWAHCFDAPVAHGDDGEVITPKTGTLALLVADLRAMGARGHTTGIAQYYGLLQNKLHLTEHIFRGVRRRLFSDGNKNGSEQKLVYTRRAAFDFRWSGSKTNGLVEQISAPKGCVFVVFVSPNVRHRQKFPTIHGWVNHWTWIDEDLAKPGAPDNWSERFNDRIWSQEQK